MPIKLKDLFHICENTEKVIQWCISLGIIFDLAGEVCKKCNHVSHFGLRKDISFSSVVIKNVVRKFPCVTDLGSMDII
jgi:hypothetical protein